MKANLFKSGLGEYQILLQVENQSEAEQLVDFDKSAEQMKLWVSGLVHAYLIFQGPQHRQERTVI